MNFFSIKNQKKEQDIFKICVSTAELAKIIGVNPEKIRSYMDSPSHSKFFIRNKDKNFNLVTTISGYIRYLKEQGKKTKGTVAQQIELEKLKIARLTVEKESLVLAKLKQETTTTKEVKVFLVKIFATLSTNLLAIPGKISRDILTCASVADADTMLKEAIREEINHISQEAGMEQHEPL